MNLTLQTIEMMSRDIIGQNYSPYMTHNLINKMYRLSTYHIGGSLLAETFNVLPGYMTIDMTESG